jgi:ATP phosphoribosyltransferase regulatory subunit
MDSVLRALPAEEPPARIYVSVDAGAEAARRLRAEGWITVAGLAPVADLEAEARRQGCSHLLDGDGPRALS